MGRDRMKGIGYGSEEDGKDGVGAGRVGRKWVGKYERRERKGRGGGRARDAKRMETP